MKNKFNLLVIDDNQEILAGLKRYLDGKKFRVATDGLDALLQIEAKKNGFDLIITDVVMPNIGGIGILSLIRQRQPGIPIIPLPKWENTRNIWQKRPVRTRFWVNHLIFLT